MKDQILQTLHDLRKYALDRGHEIELLCQEESGSLMRFANSAVSLNTSEHLIRLSITATQDRRQASVDLITNLSRLDEMKHSIDVAADMVVHSQPLSYKPTVPTYAEAFCDESGYDATLAGLSSKERLAYFNQASAGLETASLRLSGIFSCGSNTLALANTHSENSLFFRTSDAQVTVVLAHGAQKWELIAEQSAHATSDLDPGALHHELAYPQKLFAEGCPHQLPLGSYDIVFGPAATAEMLGMMKWIGFDGGLMRRGYSFLSENSVGQRIFSDKITLADDPSRPETFPFRMDFAGIPRRRYPILENGVFGGFLWSQDSADEFGAAPTGHTVRHLSLVLQGGDAEVRSLTELASQPRERDTLYVPFLHYMNIVNPSKGLITASTRFGALLFKADGSVAIPFNVRLTQSLLDIFGERVEWLSKQTLPYNSSSSYGARNPTAMIVPRFMQVRGLEISHSNPSF